jgi:hypothetical protein
MADILIRGIKMPCNVEGCEVIIRIQPNGEVLDAHKIHIGATAIPLPEGHGELIERNTVIDEFTKSAKAGQLKPWSIVKTVPIIVPAEGGTDDND